MAHHEVLVVGAGLAGLACAVDLTRAGVDTAVLEKSDGAGGRVRTDQVDDMRLDRGFQLLNPAYPALDGFVELAALHLRPFEAGVVVARRSGRTVLADPRRSLRDIGSGVLGATGTAREKLRLARYVAATLPRGGQGVKARPDMPYGEALDRAGIDGSVRTAVLEPFLAGVLGEDRQETSRVFVDLLLRTFARGRPSLPRHGIRALPDQLSAHLPAEALRLSTSVHRVDERSVRTDDGELTAEAVVVATDAVAATALIGVTTPPMRGLTTFYHRVAVSPAHRPLLHIDGDRRGPVVNSAVVSDVAPDYCRDGSLVASTVLGADDGADIARTVLRQLSAMYAADTSKWELVATYRIPHALPAMLPPLQLRQPVRLAKTLFVAGDHRDTASVQGAIVSGRRAAAAVLQSLGHNPGRSRAAGHD